MFSNLPPITKILLFVNVAMYALQWMVGEQSLGALMLWPLDMGSSFYGSDFMPWQLVTYAFLHDMHSPFHLIFNMLALVMFGAPLEYTWRDRRFLTYYMVCVVGAALCQLAVSSWAVAHGAEAYPTVGASGGIFGLLLAYGLLFPNQRVMLLIPPIPMKARTLVLLYGVIELFMGVTGRMPGVAHFAHLGGMLFGWVLIRYWRGQPPFGKRRPPGKLRSVR